MHANSYVSSAPLEKELASMYPSWWQITWASVRSKRLLSPQMFPQLPNGPAICTRPKLEIKVSPFLHRRIVPIAGLVPQLAGSRKMKTKQILMITPCLNDSIAACTPRTCDSESLGTTSASSQAMPETGNRYSSPAYESHNTAHVQRSPAHWYFIAQIYYK